MPKPAQISDYAHEELLIGKEKSKLEMQTLIDHLVKDHLKEVVKNYGRG